MADEQPGEAGQSTGAEPQSEAGEAKPSGSKSRRQFLKFAGIGAAAVGVGVAGLAVATRGFQGAGSTSTFSASAAGGIPENARRFGIMLPQLRDQPFAHPDDTVRRALLEVGKQGGIMDALDDLEAGPERLIHDPAVNGAPTDSDAHGRSPFNPTQTHGSTFFGQFIDHDITFDATSVLGSPFNPLLTPNEMTPALDLDTVFGGGPVDSPELYGAGDGPFASVRMKLSSLGDNPTLPFSDNGNGGYTWAAADGRNLQTLMLQGFVIAYIGAYNRLLEDIDDIDLSPFPSALGADLSDPYTRYKVAREIVVWHYHWLVVNEHLPQVVGEEMRDEVLRNGNRFYNPPQGNAYMPIEFSSGSYKFGHSQTDPSYRANFSSGTGASADPNKAPFYGLTFDAKLPFGFDDANTLDRDDMHGGFPAPRRYLGWQSFFDFGDGQVLHNRAINPKINTTLYTLPMTAIPGGLEVDIPNLPQRNLLRVLTWALPPGQALAREFGVDALTAKDLEDIGEIYAPFAASTPQWYYELAEAEIENGGRRLGPVGGRIVAETLFGLMRDDQNSYLNRHRDFEPFLGTDLKLGPKLDTGIAGSRDYTHANFLYYAGVVEPGIYR